MKKLVLIALLVSGCQVAGPATYTDVIIDGKYDVKVGSQDIGGKTMYFVNGMSMWIDNPPSWNDAEAVYTKAIEQVSGCKVIQDGIFWDTMIVTGPTIMRTYPEC